MILPGMRVAIVMGWLTSVIILVKPWGYPKFQLKCLPLIFGVIYLPFFVIVNADLVWNFFYPPNATVSDDPTQNTTRHVPDRIDNIVTSFNFLELVASDILLRLIFLWKAKDFADLLGRLRRYNESRTEKSSPNSKIDICITIFVYLTTFTTTILEGTKWYYDGSRPSIIREYIGVLPHSIMLALLFYLPMMIPMKCAFSTILATSGYLSTVFEDYCDHVVHNVSERKWEGMSITSYMGKQIKSLKLEPIEPRKSKSVFTNERRLLLLGRFDNVQELFALCHGIISPLALVMLGGASIAVVMKAYEVTFLSHRGHWLFFVKDVSHLLNYVCYFWILQSGQRITDKVKTQQICNLLGFWLRK